MGVALYFIFTDIETYFIDLSGGVKNFYHIKRMGSVFWTPVVWGSFVSAAALYYYYKNSKTFTWLGYSVFCLFWLCLFLSVSRGAIISFFVGMILLAIFFKSWKNLALSLVGIVLLVGLTSLHNKDTLKLIGFISDSSFETVETITSEKTNSYIFEGKKKVDEPKNTRSRFWAESIKDFVEKPEGYGLGKAGHIAARFFPKESNEAAVYSTDGWYLKLANETGIWGVISYLVLAIFHLVYCIKYWLVDRYSIHTYLFVMFIVIGIQNIVSNVLDFYSFAYFYWLIIGLTHNFYKHSSGN
jgi:hypothetical protein